ncbi:MAG: sensor histidine kinase [Rhodospirillales bacterium]|nr:sensor histidine kinase [Rhodospirillales bacterium]MBT6111209.1 sensor histidine kinase [Rhodospirillales bacterium]MBT6826888.1 sensor histidine kinase [Rhodospirillales bacterium]
MTHSKQIAGQEFLGVDVRIKNAITLKMVLPAILVIVLGAWITLGKIEDDVRAAAGASLKSMLSTTQQAVRSWVHEKRSDALLWASTREMQDHSATLLKIPHTKVALLSSPAQNYLRNWFRPVATAKGFKGFFIIGPDSINLASSRNENVGNVNLLAKQHGFLDKIWAGETAMSLPQYSDVPLERGTSTDLPPTMFVGAPIYSSSKNVSAVLLLRIDPFTHFTALFSSAVLGVSGETYGFNKQGQLISESRFDDDLRKAGLISDGHKSILNIQIRDPQVNLLHGEKSVEPRNQLPLTLMAESAIAGESGMNLEGYRDYRGVPVIGAWLWDSALGFGMTTEIDVEEVSQFQSTTRLVFIMFSALSILTLIAVGILFEKNRAQAYAANVKAQAANRAKTLFLAAMSHELRTPLNAIIGFSDMLVRQYFGPLGSDKNKEYAEDIHTSGTHLLSLVSDVLDVSSIEFGERSMSKEQLVLEDVVSECYAMTAGQAQNKGVGYTKVVQENLGSIHADRRALIQILVNILSNAIKFTPKDGEVVLRVADKNGCSVIEVTDTGQGIPADQIPTLTDPFIRGDIDFDKTQDGLGLGLSIAKSLADLHDGEIDIQSTVGKGTTVTITLPNGAARLEPNTQ